MTQVSDNKRWIGFAVTLSATLLSVLDFLIVNIALPSIQKNLKASDAQVQLMIAGYGLAFAVFLITGGRLGDIYGRRRMFQIGMLGFTAASALCGFAGSANQLIVFRVIQGLLAAFMAPQVLATVQVMFEGRDRDKATGIQGAVVGIGSFLGNVLGGFLVGADLFGLGWRSIFFVNVPIGIVALILSQIYVVESKSPSARKLDIPGALICGVALFLLIFPVAEGREQSFPWWSWLMFVSAFGLIWYFLRFEKGLAARGGSPLVSPELLETHSYVRGLGGILLLFSGISSFSLTLTLFLQKGLGVSPQNVGIIFAALSVSFLISSLGAVKLVARIGQKTLLIGLTMMQIGQIALIVLPLFFSERLNPFWLMPVLFFYGLGQGLSVPQIIRQTLGQVGIQNAGAASGVLQTTQQIAFTLGVSVVGGVFFAFAEHGESAQSYANGLAAAFACNFVFILIVRTLLARDLKRQNAEIGGPVVVMEA